MSYGYGGYGDYGGYGGYEDYGGYGDSGGYEDYGGYGDYGGGGGGGGYGGGMSQLQQQSIMRRAQWNQYMLQQGIPVQMVDLIDQRSQEMRYEDVDNLMAFSGNGRGLGYGAGPYDGAVYGDNGFGGYPYGGDYGGGW
ncbi:hypothetical protein LTR17_006675 [Elasticomyces elasticus]|nr:hypothetical protein LTR17_006675 [Elasticomyces elasticus]